MKTLIVILLFIFASLAFGAELGPSFKGIQPGNEILLPYDYDKSVPGVGSVHAELREGPAVTEITLSVWVSCIDKTGQPTKPIKRIVEHFCGYDSETFLVEGNMVIFNYRERTGSTCKREGNSYVALNKY